MSSRVKGVAVWRPFSVEGCQYREVDVIAIKKGWIEILPRFNPISYEKPLQGYEAVAVPATVVEQIVDKIE